MTKSSKTYVMTAAILGHLTRKMKLGRTLLCVHCNNEIREGDKVTIQHQRRRTQIRHYECAHEARISVENGQTEKHS